MTHPTFANFAAFLAEIDRHLVSRIGLDHESLPDACWRDYFDDGLSITEAIEAAAEDGDWASDGFWQAYGDPDADWTAP